MIFLKVKFNTINLLKNFANENMKINAKFYNFDLKFQEMK